MTAVTLACPLCAGNIQIDTAMAGQQVACPLCCGTIMLPPAELLLQFAAPQFGTPSPYDAPAMAPEPVQPAQLPDMIFSVTCPACVNAFQVTAAMSGQQVGCPYCTTPIVVPPLPSAATQSYYNLEQPEYAPQPREEPPAPQTAIAPEQQDYDINSILPPGAESVAPTSTAPTPPRKSSSKAREPSEADLMPPSRAKAASVSQAPSAPPGPPSTDRFPPGFGGGKPRDAQREERPHEERAREEKKREERLPPRKERTQPTAEKPSPPKIDERMPPPRRPAPPEETKTEASAISPPPAGSQAPPPAIDDLLPPGALPPGVAPEPTQPTLPLPATTATQPSPNFDALLPAGVVPPSAEIPAAASPSPTKAERSPTPAPSRIDHLLPPGAAEVNTAAIEQTTPKKTSSVADALLPPGATGPTLNTLPGAQVPLPVTQPGPLRPVLAPGQKKPGQGLDSLQVEGRQKEDESLADVKKLSAEEKAGRRFRRNLIMWTVCVLILFAVFYFMAR